MSGVTQVSAHTFEIGGMAAAAPSTALTPSQEPAEPPLAPHTKPVRAGLPAPHGKPPTARQILAQLRARLREVKRELSNKKALERERDQLQRLIKAATTELDNVRRLRAAG